MLYITQFHNEKKFDEENQKKNIEKHKFQNLRNFVESKFFHHFFAFENFIKILVNNI